jgi:hypothetical protein
MKITDLALAFFTYTLAVIGYFTLQSAEQTAESVEHSYIFFGYTPMEYRADHAIFDLFVRNTGRMPGTIKKFGYKFLHRTDLPHRRKQVDWEWEKVPYDYTIRPDQRETLHRFRSLKGSNIFVCFIEYEDLFTKRIRETWMAMRIHPDSYNQWGAQITRAGGDEWNAWT